MELFIKQKKELFMKQKKELFMKQKPTFRIMAITVFLTLCYSFAIGQPEWNTTVGNPGVSHPYLTWSIDALQVYDDGNGEMLYAAGGFDNFAGQPGTPNIARWDRDSNIWSGLDGGLGNGFVQAMATFDNGSGTELVVGGWFTGTISGIPYTANIAKWNGSDWSALGTGIPADLVGMMTSWDGPNGNQLYVGGRFPTAGGVTANGIAAWDGTQWHSMGDGITGSFNPYVDAMMVWDDGSGEKLYVGGRFDTMNGLSTPLIARWDGTTWEQVGDGLINDMYMFGIESMAVYDDGSGPALYVGGNEFHAPGQPVGNVSKWDGQQWTTVGPLEDGRCTSLCVFDDGSGPGLYRTGNAYWEFGYFTKLVDGDWEMVGGGITKDPYSNPWPTTSDLCVWDNALYICGYFNRAGGFQGVGGLPCGDIAAWERPVMQNQNYDLELGYQFISSRFISENPDMLIVIEEILNDNLDFVRNSEGSMLRKIGPNWVNSIGDWIVEDGYLVKMNADDSFSISGTLVDPTTPIPVETGYQFVSYLPETSMDALIAFETIIGDDLDFIRDSQGNMLRKIGPNWVNGIGDAVPCEGYLVKMFADGEIVYPVSAKSSKKVNVIPTHFKFEGGNAADLVYTIYINGLEIGDEVAAYDGEKLVGAMKINSMNVLDNDLPVFKTINSGQGFTPGEPITLKVWSKNEVVNVDFTLETVFDSYLSDVYPDEDGKYSIAKIFKGSLVSANEILIYPNPATDVINISSANEIQNVSIFNNVGQTIYNGPDIKINTSNFESGIYLIRIETKEGIETQKITIN